jgi:hypothetical protein
LFTTPNVAAPVIVKAVFPKFAVPVTVSEAGDVITELNVKLVYERPKFQLLAPLVYATVPPTLEGGVLPPTEIAPAPEVCIVPEFTSEPTSRLLPLKLKVPAFVKVKAPGIVKAPPAVNVPPVMVRLVKE